MTHTSHAERVPSTKQTKVALGCLLIMFILSILCLQAFNFVGGTIGSSLGLDQNQTALITSIPTIVLGIVCFIYGSLGDYVSLKKMTILGVALFVIGSLLGFFLHTNLWLVIIARAIQTAGGQVAGSVYLVLAARYLQGKEKVIFFGIFTAGYQLSSAIGVLAGGLLAEVDWSYLFLIPVLTVALVPFLLPSLPEVDAKKVKIDFIGFTIFGLAITLLTLYFSYSQWWMLGVSVLLFIGFAVYISMVKNPFITIDFFRNTAWLKAILLILVFYFINYSFAPLYNAIGKNVYGLTDAQVPFVLLASYIVATVVATLSGNISAMIGREASILLAGTSATIGLIGSAVCVNVGVVPLAITACFFFGGMGMLFGPVVDTVLSTVPSDQLGRGIGMNDLVMNVTASIGIAVFGPFIFSPAPNEALKDFSLLGLKDFVAVYSNLLFIFGIIFIVGLVYFLLVNKSLKAKQ